MTSSKKNSIKNSSIKQNEDKDINNLTDSKSTNFILEKKSDSNFSTLKVIGDGNCAPRAICKYAGIDEDFHAILRSIVVNIIKQDKDINKFITNETVEEYLKRMSKNKEYFTYIEITALCKEMDIECWIYLEDSKYDMQNWQMITQGKNGVLLLSFNEEKKALQCNK